MVVADDPNLCRTLAHLLRFFAHLILALRMLDQPLPAYAANRILEAYVNVLEANDQGSLSSLGTLAVADCSPPAG